MADLNLPLQKTGLVLHFYDLGRDGHRYQSGAAGNRPHHQPEQPRQGHRQLEYTITVVSQSTGKPLASTTCTASYESIEPGYLDVEDNIQRAKTLAVGLAFSVGAANNALRESEIDIIHGWVRTNFGSADASEAVQLELERALRKTAAFFLGIGATVRSQVWRRAAA